MLPNRIISYSVSFALLIIFFSDSFSHSHWLQHINPLRIFPRFRNRSRAYATTNSNQLNNSASNADFTSSPVGLQNLGNTCYMNSVLQGLYYCQHFRDGILEFSFNKTTITESNNNNIIGTSSAKSSSSPSSININKDYNSIVLMQYLFQQLMGSARTSSVNTINLARYLKVNVQLQEDAQEFYLKVLDTLNKEINHFQKDTNNHSNNINNNDLSGSRSGSNNTSITSEHKQQSLSSLFSGTTENYISGLAVDFIKSKTQKFLDLSLEVTPSLYESIEAFLTPVILDGDNQYNTKEFGAISVVKGLTFKTLPKILAIQLNRFTYDVNTGGIKKIGDRLEFPTQLSMTSYITDGVSTDSDTVSSSSSSNSNSNTQKNNNSNYHYDLKSIIVHMGTPHYGHYIALVRPHPHTQPDTWLKLDDDRVSQITTQQMQDIAFGGTGNSQSSSLFQGSLGGVSSTAYMLLYEQSSPSPLSSQSK